MLKWIPWRNRVVLRWSWPPMEKCRRMKRPVVSKNWIYSWLWKSSRIRQQFYRSESFAMNTGILTSGSTVKNHFSLKTVSGYSVIRKTSFRSWFLVCQRASTPMTPSRQQIEHLTFSSSSSSSPIITAPSDSETRAREDLVNFKDTFKTRQSLFYIFFKLVFVTNSNIKWQ